MPQAIDMEYCMIVIDKLISPHTPVEQVEPLLRDLMDSVYHPQMKELAQKIVDPELDIVERRKLKEKFRNFDHGGANDYSEVNYKDLIDKLLDPSLPDHEYKPTMKALLDGDLDQDKKNMVSAIISCQNKDQKANMVKRFKSLFDREKEERERALKERAEAKKAKEREKAELEANLLKFSDDGMTLINKFLDKKIPREKKTEIYDRLMEPDIDAEIKNLAIQLVNATKASERPQMIEDFKKRREEEKIAAVKRKEEEARRKAEEEKENKDLKMQRKQQLLMQKKKSDMMKKRDLMLKYRAEERKRDGGLGPSSVQEREEWRRKEREKMRLEILRFREQSRLNMMKQEREDRLKQGWLVTTFDSSYNINIQVVVPDLATSLAPAEQQQYRAALAALNLSQVSEKKPEPEKPKEIVPEERKPEDKHEKAEEKVDEEFDKYFKIFVDPSLTEEAESTHVKQLIKEKKSALVRSLAVRLASVPGAGKSKVFQTLIKKFCPEKVNSDQPTVNPQKEKAEEETKVEVKESPPGVTVESSKPAKDVVMKENEDAPQEAVVQNNSKRRLSQDSNSGNESKKLKLVDVFEGKDKEGKEENDKSSTEKKKKKKKKHKDDKEKEKQEGDEGERKYDKKKKKHKNKEKHKRKEREKETEMSERADRRSSIESRDSKSGSEDIKPLLEMSGSEIKQRFKLKNFNAGVRIRNCRKLSRAIQKQDEERDRRWEERSKESESSSRQKTRSPSRPKSSASTNSSRSKSNSVRSKSPTRSRSNSARSRSPIISRSNSPLSRSTSRSRSVISRSPVRSRSNSSRSRSPIRYISSKSRSNSPIRSPSISSRSRSNSP